MKPKDLELNDSYYSCCANALIKANQRMTLREMQLIQIAIAQICKDDNKLYTYTTTAAELSKFLGVSIQAIYKDYEQITERLLKNVVTVRYNNVVERFQWLSYAKYDKNDNTITIKLHDQLKPFLLGLNKLYTQIDLNSILQFKSYYALRLYQLLISEYGQTKKTTFKMTIDEIRDFFSIEKDKYSRVYDLVKKTIYAAITEINGTDLCHIKDYELIHSAGKGKPLKAVSFNVKWDM